ncbi:MAG: nuclear transport factor 2 family protein [Ottowia sp.]|uniref:YybH family protein n=1 Tax=Ottowia sp. TaxID=1898956 RepID=UPI0039E61103
MPKPRYRAAQSAGSADDVEAAFYEALQAGDIDQLMACWADEDDIVCVHPGGPRLVGAAAIRQAFEAMFAAGSIRAYPERLRRLDALGAAVHNVLERIELVTAEGTQRAWVVATNVYLKTAQGWRLAAHHASPGRAEVAEVTQPGQLLH